MVKTARREKKAFVGRWILIQTMLWEKEFNLAILNYDLYRKAATLSAV